MDTSEQLTTTVSTKGQVILPIAVRKQKNWGAGTRLIVETTAEGVLLREAPLFKRTRIEDVYASAGYKGPPKTLQEMDEAIMREVALRDARSRY
jgi:AbrB family looped-hinge helix DNA binding protein